MASLSDLDCGVVAFISPLGDAMATEVANRQTGEHKIVPGPVELRFDDEGTGYLVGGGPSQWLEDTLLHTAAKDASGRIYISGEGGSLWRDTLARRFATRYMAISLMGGDEQRWTVYRLELPDAGCQLYLQLKLAQDPLVKVRSCSSTSPTSIVFRVMCMP